ncbi:nucleotide exchange factor GrpE [Lactobacillus selangorensis]|uniref:nucleotide exchange factor GrpE n=1 Tax=Lactobacillus selangorensis TaxID=81857 RepID=UPI000708A756|nr:nucleotide exchange factor GrpE [Lactobacillus selangorensis]
MATEKDNASTDAKAQVEKLNRENLHELSQDENEAAADEQDLQKKLDDTEDQYLRAAAEIKNMNARFKREQEQTAKYSGQKLATAILPVADNLERALQTEPTDDSSKQLHKGVEMIYQHLVQALKDNNVTAIDAAGVKFDPKIHQAVQTVPADKDHPADTVTQILQKGYQLKDRVIRPAMVTVAQ